MSCIFLTSSNSSLKELSEKIRAGNSESDCNSQHRVRVIGWRDEVWDGNRAEKVLLFQRSYSLPNRNLLSFIFFNLFIFNWKIIALHCCVGSCHVSTRISHGYALVPSLYTSLPFPTPSYPSRLSRSTRFELPATIQHISMV